MNKFKQEMVVRKINRYLAQNDLTINDLRQGIQTHVTESVLKSYLKCSRVMPYPIMGEIAQFMGVAPKVLYNELEVIKYTPYREVAPVVDVVKESHHYTSKHNGILLWQVTQRFINDCRAVRKKKKLKIIEVAKIAHVSPATISGMECNIRPRTKITNMERIAVAHGLNPDDYK